MAGRTVIQISFLSEDCQFCVFDHDIESIIDILMINIMMCLINY
jgi:hypothetical protein